VTLRKRHTWTWDIGIHDRQCTSAKAWTSWRKWQQVLKTLHTHPRREGGHRPSITGSSRASISGSTAEGISSRRPFLSTISSWTSRASRCATGAVEDKGAGVPEESASGMNAGGVSSPSSPSRYCRRQVVSRERDTPCRRAVDDTCRCPRKLSSTSRTLSASPQCRRRGPSAAERTSISGLNLWSAIRSDLPPASTSRQTASTGLQLPISVERRIDSPVSLGLARNDPIMIRHVAPND